MVCFDTASKEKWRTVYVGHFKRWKVYPNGEREGFDGKGNAPEKDPTDTLRIRPSIEKERIKWAIRVFKWYATEAISPKMIADRLNTLKVDPVFGEAWNKVLVLNLLRNPAYIGRPTWNKKASGRFVEYLSGRVREVVHDGHAGRRRTAADFIQPAKPEYKPMVPLDTWDKVQAKIQVASTEQGKRLKRPPNTESLWLKPFLICGKCNKPMRATRGDSTPYLSASYFCGTYGTLGTHNPTGCRCHRVQHTVLERLVLRYLKDTQPKVGQLLEAVTTGDSDLMQPMLEDLAGVVHRHASVFEEMHDFIENTDLPDWRQHRNAGRGFEEVYGLVYESVRPRIEAAIQAKEDELDKMVVDYRGLSETARSRANAIIDAEQAEIDGLRRQAKDLRVPWDNLKAELKGRRKALDDAEAIIGKRCDGRRKTEALRGVIDRIVCHFRYTGQDGKPTAKKSFLDSVEIVSVSGQTATLRTGTAPGRG